VRIVVGRDGPDGKPRDRGALISSGVTVLAWWSVRILLIALGAVLLGTLIGALWTVVLPVIFGVLLTTVLYPPAAWLVRHGWPRALAAGVVLVGALGIVALVFWGIAPSVAGQADEISAGAVAGLQQIQNLLSGPPFNLGQGQIGAALSSIVAQLQASATTIAGGVLTGVSAVASGLLNVVLALVLAFFFVKDGPHFVPWLVGVTGDRAGRHLRPLLDRTWRTLGGFIRTQALVSLVDAVFIGVGLLILGVPLALPLVVLTFFGGFIPIIGALVAGALAVLVALVTKGFTTALIVLAIIIAVQQIEGNVLQPILQSRSLKLHGAIVLLAVTAGGALYGIAGAFLAVPAAAVAAEILRYMGQEIDLRTGKGDPEDPTDVLAEDVADPAEPTEAVPAADSGAAPEPAARTDP
jgi:predicted PurR-regulated permease PerM